MLHLFGGAPEISIFMIPHTNENGQTEDVPDLSPITITLMCTELSAQLGKLNEVGLIVSPHIGTKVLINYICPLFSYAPTKVKLYNLTTVDEYYVDMEEIKIKGNNTSLLHELGIKEGHKLIMFQDCIHKNESANFKELENYFGFKVIPQRYFELQQLEE
jgi:hypothetical protein